MKDKQVVNVYWQFKIVIEMLSCSGTE